MKTPVVTFAAYSGSGKTTYLSTLIPKLKSLGLHVAVIKHDGHEFQIDRPGTDTSRLYAAGADTVAIASANQLAIIRRASLAVADIVPEIQGTDLILTEGFKHGPFPKVALYRKASGKPLAVPAENCLAIVSDVPMEAPCPVFPLNDPEPMAAFLADWLKQQKGD